MKTTLFSLLFSFAALFAAAPARAQSVNPIPLTDDQRQELYVHFHTESTIALFWAEWYAITPTETAYYNGRAEGLILAAALLDANPTMSRDDLVSLLRDYVASTLWWAEYYTYGPIDYAYYVGRADGLNQALYFVAQWPVLTP